MQYFINIFCGTAIEFVTRIKLVTILNPLTPLVKREIISWYFEHSICSRTKSHTTTHKAENPAKNQLYPFLTHTHQNSKVFQTSDPIVTPRHFRTDANECDRRPGIIFESDMCGLHTHFNLCVCVHSKTEIHVSGDGACIRIRFFANHLFRRASSVGSRAVLDRLTL